MAKNINKNNLLKTTLALLLALIFCSTLSISVFAASDNTFGNECLYSPECIIGTSDKGLETRIPNIINVDWSATESEIIISVQNIGVDTVDSFTGTVNIESDTPIPFSIYKIKPLDTVTINVDANMSRCYESIVVNYCAIDGENEIGAGTSPGHRQMPTLFSSVWVKGTYPTIEYSINDHYKRHGKEVGSTNIVDYARKAYNYRASVVSDIGALSSNSLNSIYKITISSGATKSHKYKHKTNLQYAILSDSGYYIVSYGK